MDCLEETPLPPHGNTWKIGEREGREGTSYVPFSSSFRSASGIGGGLEEEEEEEEEEPAVEG